MIILLYRSQYPNLRLALLAANQVNISSNRLSYRLRAGKPISNALIAISNPLLLGIDLGKLLKHKFLCLGFNAFAGICHQRF